jgi:glycosyltransferase involved in cell wall biosynthesis
MEIRKIQKPRVALLTSLWFPFNSGSSITLEKLAKHLLSLGYEVDLLTRNLEGSLPKRIQELERSTGLTVKRFGQKSRSWNPLMKSWYILRSAAELFWNRKKYALIHAHSLSAAFAMKLGASKNRCPRLLTIHEHHLGGDGSFLLRFFERILFLETDYTQLISTSEDFLKYPNVNDSLLVFPHGIDTTRFEIKDKTKKKASAGKNNEQLRLLYVGPLRRTSALDLLLRAVKDLIESSDFIRTRKDFQVHIVGSGPALAGLKKLAENLEIAGHIKWNTSLSENKLIEAYHSADLFLMPNRTGGLPQSLLEACASGLPILASDSGDNSKLVIENVNGYLFPKGNRKELLYHLGQFAQNPHAEQMGEASVELVREEYSWEKSLERHRLLYEQEIKNAGSQKKDNSHLHSYGPLQAPKILFKNLAFRKQCLPYQGKKRLYFGLSLDLEPQRLTTALDESEVADFLERFSEFTANLGCTSTILVRAEFFKSIYQEIKGMEDSGHEIGFKFRELEWKDGPSSKKLLRDLSSILEDYPLSSLRHVRLPDERGIGTEADLALLAQHGLDSASVSQDPLARFHFHLGLPYPEFLKMDLETWLQMEDGALLESVKRLMAFQVNAGLRPHLIFRCKSYEFASHEGIAHASGENFSLLARKLAYLKDHLEVEFVSLTEMSEHLGG